MYKYLCHIAIKVRTEDGWYTIPVLKGETGLNAYELAVQQGFEGTVGQWLASLVGPQGVAGTPGATGATGAQGLQGNFNEFIYKRTATNDAPVTPITTAEGVPATWSGIPIGVNVDFPYEWVCKRTKTIGVWGSYSTAALWAVYSSGNGGSYTLPQATNSALGGVKAAEKGSGDTIEVKIDTQSGKLYVPPSGSGSGDVLDVAPETPSKIYGRLSSEPPVWTEIVPIEGSVGTLQQVTTQGATTDRKVSLGGGAIIDSILTIPNASPSEIPAGKMAIYSDEAGFSGQTPSTPQIPPATINSIGGIIVGSGLSVDGVGTLSVTGGGGGGVTVHNELSGRDALDVHPISSISGLATGLSEMSASILTALNHISDAGAHSTLFANKANKNGNINEDFSAKLLTMIENSNTNLRIPASGPSGGVSGAWYMYIE